MLDKAVEARADHVTVDLSDVSFLDSMGIGALLVVHRLGARLTLRNPAPRVRNVLELNSSERLGMTAAAGGPAWFR